MKELIKSYRQQMVTVADKLAQEICGGNHTPTEIVQLVGVLLTVHEKVGAYDRIMFGGDDGGGAG